MTDKDKDDTNSSVLHADKDHRFASNDYLPSALPDYPSLLAAETHKCSMLEQKLSWHREYLAKVESERDDLRDAVLHLVEKIEQAQPLYPDFSVWPRSRLTVGNNGAQNGCMNCREVQATLREERATHARYRNTVEQRARALEARLDVPRALTSTNDDRIDQHSVQRERTSISRAKTLLAIVNTKATRNRAYEEDLGILFDTVLQPHAERPALDDPPSPTTEPTSLNPSLQLLSHQIDEVSNKIDALQRPREAFRPVSPSAAHNNPEPPRVSSTPALEKLTTKVAALGAKIDDLRLSEEGLRALIHGARLSTGEERRQEEEATAARPDLLPIPAPSAQVESETDTVVVDVKAGVDQATHAFDSQFDKVEEDEEGPYTPEIVLAAFLHQGGSTSEMDTARLNNASTSSSPFSSSSSSPPHTPYSEFGERPMELATPLSVHSFLVNFVVPTSPDAPGVLSLDADESGSDG